MKIEHDEVVVEDISDVALELTAGGMHKGGYITGSAITTALLGC